MVASAGYDRLREPGVAEVSFTVADDLQGRGVATRMLEQLASIAAAEGIQRFDAEVLDDNTSMLRVFERAGFDLRSRGDFDEVIVSLDIRPTEAIQERIDERDHLAAVASLRPVLAPASVAVVGASPERGSVGARLFANIVRGDFSGVAVPVNREGGVVRSVRSVASLSELGDVPELVVVAVPTEDVLDVAAQAAEIGSKALVVTSPSFSGPAGDGPGREQQLLEVVRSAGLRMVGPGSLGVVNNDPAISLNATFAGEPVPAGGLAISSQSRAIAITLLGQAAARRLGISSFVALGERADVSNNDLLEYWEEDERTSAVMLYVETFGNPDHFARIARRVARRKPILAIKGRRAEAPPTGARSHTAAALRGDAVVDALLRHAGVMRFRSGEEHFHVAEFFEAQPLPRGRRVGIATNSGGLATIAADACGSRGLAVGGSPAVEPHAEPTDYAAGVRELLAGDAVDAVMACYVELSGGDPRPVLAAVSEVARGQDKPVVASIVGEDGRLPESTSADVPNFLFPETCAGVLARAVERREWLSRPRGQRPTFDDIDADAARAWATAWLEGARATVEDGWLDVPEAGAVLATHAIRFVDSRRCPDPDSAVLAAAALGGPVALKADFPPPAHAGDVDAVLLGIEGEAAVRSGWRELERRVRSAGRDWRGALVEPLVEAGADVLLGALADAELGQGWRSAWVAAWPASGATSRIACSRSPTWTPTS